MKKDTNWIVALVCFITLMTAAAAAGALVGAVLQILTRYI